MKPAGPPQKGRRPYAKGGYYSVKARLKRGGLAAIDGRCQAGRAIAQDRADLEAHVGGNPSATMSRVIDSILTLDLLIGAGVAALQAVGPVDRRKHAYRPVARELAGLLEKRHRLLADLGWAPKVKTPTLAEYLAAREAKAKQQAPPGSTNAGPADGGAVPAEKLVPAPEVEDDVRVV